MYIPLSFCIKQFHTSSVLFSKAHLVLHYGCPFFPEQNTTGFHLFFSFFLISKERKKEKNGGCGRK